MTTTQTEFVLGNRKQSVPCFHRVHINVSVCLEESEMLWELQEPASKSFHSFFKFETSTSVSITR